MCTGGLAGMLRECFQVVLGCSMRGAVATGGWRFGRKQVLRNGTAWPCCHRQRPPPSPAGGNNYQCLLQAWDEMHEGVRVWLHAQGQALPPGGAHLMPASPYPYNPFPPGSTAHHLSTMCPSLPGSHGSASHSIGKATYAAVLRAFSALEAGGAAGQHALSQVGPAGTDASRLCWG